MSINFGSRLFVSSCSVLRTYVRHESSSASASLEDRMEFFKILSSVQFLAPIDRGSLSRREPAVFSFSTHFAQSVTRTIKKTDSGIGDKAMEPQKKPKRESIRQAFPLSTTDALLQEFTQHPTQKGRLGRGGSAEFHCPRREPLAINH